MVHVQGDRWEGLAEGRLEKRLEISEAMWYWGI